MSRAVTVLFRLLCVWTCFLPGAAQAQPNGSETRLVLLVDPGMPAMVHRLREEIEALGLEVRVVAVEEPEQPLEARARASGALAAIRVTLVGQRAVDMTIVDRATGKMVSRRLAIDLRGDPASAELIATRTAELLRASLIELSTPHPPRGEVRAPPALVEVTRDERIEARSLRPALAAGSALVVSPGIPAWTDVWAGMSALWDRRFGLGVQVFVPITGSRLSLSEGAVEIFCSRVRAGGVLSVPLYRDRIFARTQAGLVLSRLSLSGFANAPYVDQRETAVTWGPWLEGGLGFGLTRSISAWLAGDAALTFPRMLIRSAGREVVNWGRPVTSLNAGLELALP